MIARIGSPMPYVSRQLFGGKGKNLLEIGEEFSVPEGFVVSSEEYVKFFLTNNLRGVIQQILRDHKAPEDIESRAKEAFAQARFPSNIEDVLFRELEILQEQAAKTNDPQAVRSSAIDEDGSINSFAGQHDTFFGKLTEQTMLEYVKLCYASAFNSVALKYREEHKLGIPTGMAVVIQNMKEFETGFVVYTAAPFDYENLIIEAAPGHCKSVVDGRPVDSFRVNIRDKNKIISKINKNKSMQWQYDHQEGKLKLVPTPSHFVDKPSLSPEQIAKITEVVLDIESCYALGFPKDRKPQDLEGGFDYKGKLWITQSRDITGMSYKAPDIVLPKLTTIIGQSQNVGNTGVYDGPIVVITDVDPNGTTFTLKDGQEIRSLDSKFTTGYVLVTPETNPTLDSYIKNCKAIIATECGIMSHAGATARERGLIFIGCVESTDHKQLQDKLDHGDIVCVGANKEKGVIGYR